MLPVPSDSQLLQQFAQDKSQAAFAQLVQRHSPWLYSACQRRLGDAALAEDATQTAFLLLAQRAPRLLHLRTVSPWLHQTAKFCGLQILRSRRRAQRHEFEAALMKSAHLPSPSPSHWDDIQAELEPALDRLSPRDRTAILLRFYEQKTHAEISAMLGISLDAAQKRLTRALDRLRDLLQHKLQRSGRADAQLSALVLGDLLAHHGVGAAPASLVTSLSSGAAQTAASASPIVKQVLFSIKLAKLKVAAMLIAALAIPSAFLLSQLSPSMPVLAQAPSIAPPPAAPPLAPSPTAPIAKPPATFQARPAMNSVFPVPNLFLVANPQAGSFSVDLDEATKRTPDSVPASHIKSLLAQYNPNSQKPGVCSYEAPYPMLAGKRVRLSAWFKTSNVDQWCGMELMAFTRDRQVLADDDMSPRPMHGTMDWTRQQLVMDIPKGTNSVALQAFLFGKGDVWVDDFQLEIVGPDVPLTDADPWRKFSYYGPNYTSAPDPQVQHDGHATICIASTPQATAKQWIDYLHQEYNVERLRGSKVTVRLWMKSTGITGGAVPIINVYSPAGAVASQARSSRSILRGTADWKEYTAVVDVPKEATNLYWGAVMSGTGKLWVDIDSAKLITGDDQTDLGL